MFENTLFSRLSKLLLSEPKLNIAREHILLINHCYPFKQNIHFLINYKHIFENGYDETDDEEIALSGDEDE